VLDGGDEDVECRWKYGFDPSQDAGGS